ncbi:MAG: hypothetical protein KDB79_01880 [Acidobacteria bacterium]|nr:hypothetical protein [Acidobacteriota bacterium]
MKTFFRVLMLGIFAVVLTASFAPATYGQDPIEEKTALYEKYTANYNGTTEQRRIAVKAAKDYIEKYGANDEDKEIVDYLKNAIPSIEKSIEDDVKAEAAEKARREKQARYARFNKDVTAKNWDDAYVSGAAILAEEPDMLDVILVLGSIGLDEIAKTPPVTKYNDATIKYANLAIEKMKNGVKSTDYGAYAYSYNNKDNATSWMNYTIGMIMYHSQGKTDPVKKKDALNYLYAATRLESDRKKEPRIYGTIGDWYFAKATELNTERLKLDQADEANFAAIDKSVALEKAYADRAIDAYARALQIARANTKVSQAYKDTMLDLIKKLYNFRYQQPELKTDEKINSYIAGIMSKPMPDPAADVTPVIETPVTTTDEKATEGNASGARTRTVSAKTGNR